MKRTIITISREYGSGGRQIGELAAKRLSIPFYNHNLIDMVAHETGLASSYIENWEEHVSSPQMWGMPVFAGLTGNYFDSAYYSNEDRMFAAQSKIISDIAAHGSAVIVGRCADYLLREDPDAIRVFVFAAEAVRLQRIQAEYGAVDEADALQQMKTVDKGRAAYVRKYAERTWGDLRNYHLLIDSGCFGVETAAEMIALAVRQRV